MFEIGEVIIIWIGVASGLYLVGIFLADSYNEWLKNRIDERHKQRNFLTNRMLLKMKEEKRDE